MVFTGDQYRDIFLIWNRQTEGAQKKVADTGGDASFNGGFGSSVGACVGMQIFRHKTQKPKFYIGVPVILLLQAGIVIYVYLK